MARAGRKSAASKRENISLAGKPKQAPQGDHGPRTAAQQDGTYLVQADKDNPNGMAQKRRINQITAMHNEGQLSIRQYQAGIELQDAWLANVGLNSGDSDYSKPIVDCSGSSERYSDMQAATIQRWTTAMSAVPTAMRSIIKHVCIANEGFGLPIHMLDVREYMQDMHRANLKVALDLVANKLRY